MAVNIEPDPILEDEAIFYEPMRRLSADMRKAAETMSDAEVRYLIDLFYSQQEQRKRGDNQLRASSADQEPNSLTRFLAAQVEALEGACNGALQVVARRTRAGRWCMGHKGISGVLTAGLLASLDITRAPTAASFWRFAGLDPTWEWLGKERASKLVAELSEVLPGRPRPQEILEAAARRVCTAPEGLLARIERQTRPKNAREATRSLEEVRASMTRAQLVGALATRPWNAQLKTLQWKLMDCLVKVQNRDDAPYYCEMYQRRKREEWQRNFAGAYQQQCTAALSRNLTPLQRPWYEGRYDAEALKVQAAAGESPSAWKLPEPREGGTPMLPPGRIELRARRVAVKQFLADLHYCLYEEAYGTAPVPNADQQARGKQHFRVPPRWAETR